MWGSVSLLLRKGTWSLILSKLILKKEPMDPMNMVDELLPTEADLRYFCKQNGLQSSSVVIMAIEAYKVLLY